MIETNFGAYLTIKEGTSLNDLIEQITKIKSEMDKINVELYCSLPIIQLCFTTNKSEEK